MSATLLDYLPALIGSVAILAVIFGSFKLNTMLRARAMRSLATGRGLRYIGPSAPKWGGLIKIRPRVPLALNWCPANDITQVWNVIEGEQNGVRVLMFDSVSRETRAFCTFIACQAEENPFEKDAPGGRTVRSRDWRVLYRESDFVSGWTYWSLSIPCLEHQLNLIGRAADSAGSKNAVPNPQ